MGTQFAYKHSTLGATETTETNLGTITTPSSGVSRISGIAVVVGLQTGTADDGCVGWGRISFYQSGEIDGIPCAILCREDLGQEHVAPEFIDVDIPISPQTKINCFITLSVAQGGTCDGIVHIRFE